MENTQKSLESLLSLYSPNDEKMLADLSPTKGVFSISVIIVCKNEERCIKKSSTAILKQLSIEDELIVVDTGSSDDTIKILKALSHKDLRIRIVRTTWTDSFSEARNQGISFATKQWIFFVDSDEYLQSSSLNSLRTVLSYFHDEDNYVFSPTIVNMQKNHSIYTVKRIFKNKVGFQFINHIHEELIQTGKVKTHYSNIKNVILEHDGYEHSVMNEKHKSQRNVALIYKDLAEDDSNGKTWYFLARDGEGALSSEQRILALKNAINLCNPNSEIDFLLRSYSDLIAMRISQGDFAAATHLIDDGKKICPAFYNQVSHYR